MTDLEIIGIIEKYVAIEKGKAAERCNTPILMRHPEGMVSAFDMVLRKLKELKGNNDA